MSRKLDAVAQIVSLNGGDLKGRTRLQKSFYFLEALDLGFDFDFQYYHYGPYSEELAEAVQDSVALGLVSQDWGQGSYPFAVYRSKEGTPASDVDGARVRTLTILNKYNAVALELAATADYLATSGYGDKAWDETRVRKPTKASNENVAAAKQLLTELGRTPN